MYEIAEAKPDIECVWPLINGNTEVNIKIILILKYNPSGYHLVGLAFWSAAYVFSHFRQVKKAIQAEVKTSLAYFLYFYPHTHRPGIDLNSFIKQY